MARPRPYRPNLYFLGNTGHGTGEQVHEPQHLCRQFVRLGRGRGELLTQLLKEIALSEVRLANEIPVQEVKIGGCPELTVLENGACAEQAPRPPLGDREKQRGRGSIAWHDISFHHSDRAWNTRPRRRAWATGRVPNIRQAANSAQSELERGQAAE